jgi:hypothetical protein
VLEVYVQWLASFLTGRFTTFNTQGFPLSPILYIFYNADLVASEDTENIRYIDDITLIAVGQLDRQNCETLEREFSGPWSRAYLSGPSLMQQHQPICTDRAAGRGWGTGLSE